MGGSGGVRGAKARRVLGFYRVHFGVSVPFNVLCDGTLIHFALKHKLFLKEALPGLFGRQVAAHVVVSSCVVSELRSLGEEFSAASLMASRARRVDCPHASKRVPASECILELFKEEQHGMLLGTVDKELISAVRAIGGVPIVTISSGSLILETPSTQSRSLALEIERNKRKRSSLPPPKPAAEDSLTPRFRRRKARGPNPLSVKKKKTTESTVTKKKKKKKNKSQTSENTEAKLAQVLEVEASRANKSNEGADEGQPEGTIEKAGVRKRGKRKRKRGSELESSSKEPEALPEPEQPSMKRHRRKRRSAKSVTHE
mmetsp:Transcript_21617/g.88175  ORF Transcript_21617/g.88175 Transcript_21617/m.88175 type:complete len:315 (-) Transcript_21617:1339-2283(-)